MYSTRSVVLAVIALALLAWEIPRLFGGNTAEAPTLEGDPEPGQGQRSAYLSLFLLANLTGLPAYAARAGRSRGEVERADGHHQYDMSRADAASLATTWG
ncbi:MAG: hypothetical protein AB1331_10030 [Bacillota bacterium]